MIGKPLLLVAALALPAMAESISIDPDWVGPDSTEYDLVEEVDLILLVRAVGTRGEEVRFKLLEAVKGELEKGAWLGARSDARQGARHLVFLTRNGEGWDHSEIGFIEIKAEDEDWVQVLRLFSGIAALDDEELETQALRELRETAVAAPDRYPAALLIRMIDLHFGTPTPDKPFSDLMDLYAAAETDAERLAVLWALHHGEHPETAGFFRSLLLGGEPLSLMRPVLDWLRASSGDDLPLMRDLARVWLGHPREARTGLLEVMIDNAELEDAPLLWSLLPSADRAAKVLLVDHVLGGKGPDPFADRLSLPRDEPLTADLFLLWISGSPSTAARARLGELLRKDQARDWRPAASLEELLSAFETSRVPAERREILMEIERRTGAGEADGDLAMFWRLLRRASPREAEGILGWAYYLSVDEEELAAFYRSVSGEEEKNRALWLLFAVQGESDVGPLLSAAGSLGEGSVRLERVARAFLTCPSEEIRLHLVAHFEFEEEELATAGDFLAMLKILGGASLAEARTLASWFTRNPGPEAQSLLWRLPIPSLYLDSGLAEALAASGDHEVLDMALGLRRRLTTEDDLWAIRVLARSPLPAAQEEARRILEDGRHARLQLMWELAEEDNASPWRDWYLQEIADSETVDEATRENALTYLARLSEPQP